MDTQNTVLEKQQGMKNLDAENMQQQKEEETKNATPKTNLMDELNMPKEITITAWYSPEIPVSQGPENYWGLPGLILEVNDGKTTILCSKVVLNLKDKVEKEVLFNHTKYLHEYYY